MLRSEAAHRATDSGLATSSCVTLTPGKACSSVACAGCRQAAMTRLPRWTSCRTNCGGGAGGAGRVRRRRCGGAAGGGHNRHAPPPTPPPAPPPPRNRVLATLASRPIERDAPATTTVCPVIGAAIASTRAGYASREASTIKGAGKERAQAGQGNLCAWPVARLAPCSLHRPRHPPTPSTLKPGSRLAPRSPPSAHRSEPLAAAGWGALAHAPWAPVSWGGRVLRMQYAGSARAGGP